MTAAPNTGALFAGPAAPGPIRPPLVEVTLDGEPAPRIAVRSIEHALGGAPRATLSVGLGREAGSGPDVRLEDAAPEVRPGRAVRVRLLRGGVFPGAAVEDLVLFEGTIGGVEAGLSPEGEGLEFEAVDQAAPVLEQRVGGRRIVLADDTVAHVAGLDLVFNPEGRPNADPADLWFAPVAPPGAAAWTLDRAVAYLLTEYVDPAELAVPSAAAITAAVGDLVPRDISLEGLTLGEALEALLEPVGGHVRIAAEPGPAGVRRRLELWVPERAPTAALAHQPVGETFDPAGTQFSALAAGLEFGASPRRYLARGGRKRFESTFELVPGWDDALADYQAWLYSPATNPDFGSVRDVYRKWVLNEAGDYTAAPYDRGPPPDLSDVFEGAAYVRRRRRFLPALARDALGRGRGVWIEWSRDDGGTWQRLTQAARVLRDECGILLTGEFLRPVYLWACMTGAARVRVTASLESDEVLQAEWTPPEGGDLAGRTRVLPVPGGYRYRKVAPGSVFYGTDADEADDTSPLEALVRAAWEADRRVPAPGRVRIPYLALGHRPGTRLAGLRGRRLALAREHPGSLADPVVRTVRLRLAPEPETELELE